MAENVVISFVSDTDDLQKVVPALEQITAADATLGAEVKKTTATFSERQKALDQQTKSTAGAKLTLDQLSNSVKELNKNVIGNASTKQVEQFATQMGQATTKSTTLVTQLRALKQELTILEGAGKAGSKAFEDLAVKAGKLQNALGDTQQRIRILASDTKNLDAALSLATGLAGSFALVQGAAALFGDENEELQKSLLKVQASLAILNGLQAVAATLNKDSAASVVILSAAQKAYTFIVGGTTGALKLLRLAFAATGIGLLILGIIALVQNFDRLKVAILGGVNPALKTLSEQKQKLVELSEKSAESTALEERRLIALGATDTEILKLRIDNIGKYLIALKEQQQVEELILNKQLESVGKQQGILASLKSFGGVGGAGAGLLEMFGFGSPAEVAQQSQKLSDITAKISEAQVKVLEAQKEIGDISSEASKKAQAELEKLVDSTISTGDQIFKATKAAQDMANDELEAFVNSVILSQEIALESVVDIVDQTIAEQERLAENDRRNLEEKKQRDLDYVQAYAGVVDQLFQFGLQLNQNEIDALNDKHDKGLINEKKYRREMAVLLRKQAAAEKAKAAFDIIIGTAVAIMNALSIPIAGIALAAANAIAGGVQLAIVLSQKLPEVPQFAKGTEKVKGGKPGKDSVPAILMPGERIVPAHINAMLGDIPNADLPKLLGVYPDLPYLSDASMNAMEKYSSHSSGINYDLLAEKVGKVIAKHPKVNVHFDEHNVIAIVEEGISKKKSLDNYFSWKG